MAAIKKSEACTECGDAPRVRKGKRFKLCDVCRRADTTRRWRVRRARRTLGFVIGKLVEFNLGHGWRAAYLISMTACYASVQPLGACGRVPDIETVSLDNLKPASVQSPSMPTVDDFYRKMETMKPKKVVVLVAGPPTAFISRISDAVRAAAPILSAMSNMEDLLREEPPVVLDEKHELAGPEVGDTSFPFGANAPVQASKTPNGDIPKSSRAVTPKLAKLEVGAKYGPWKTLEYTGHSRWKCVSDSGEAKVLYSAELRSAAALTN